MIIKPDAPECKELTKGDLTASSALKPYLSGCVGRVHRGLQRPNPINSDVRGHLHRSAVDGYAQLDDPGVLVCADRLRLQPGSLDVGDGIPRRIPRRWRAALHRWAGSGLANTASDCQPHHEHGRARGTRAPPTARHGPRVERGRASDVRAELEAAAALVHCL